MRASPMACIALTAWLTGCGGGPPEMATDPTDPTLNTPQVGVTNSDALAVGYLTGDSFLQALVAGVEDGAVGLRLDNALRDLDAALSSADRAVLLHTLSGTLADHDGSTADLTADDQLAVAVFQIMLGHTEWLLTRVPEHVGARLMVAPSGHPSSDSQRAVGAVPNHE